jgi:hypothetical protein
MKKGGSYSGPLKVLQFIASLLVGGAEYPVAAMVAGLDPQRFQVQAAIKRSQSVKFFQTPRLSSL